MAKEFYGGPKPQAAKLVRIEQVAALLEEARARGFAMSVRQVHYQFISKLGYPNNKDTYRLVQYSCDRGRMYGLLDWDDIEDRGRASISLPHWESPADLINSAADQYRIDHWKNQPTRWEVWFEKAALTPVFDRVCRELDLTYLACKGYNSLTEVHIGVKRLLRYAEAGQRCTILQFSDHDPAGLTMTEALQRRLREFGCDVEVRRMALTIDQIRNHNLPPNRVDAKTFRRCWYQEQFGPDTWELDALSPEALASLVRATVKAAIEPRAWAMSDMSEKRDCGMLGAVRDRWDEVVAMLKKGRR